MELFVAWTSALAFTFQVYFDFSGYTDMALGLARVFGITLPMNFNSPLKASSIIEFWSRWHITLTRFLTAYIYTPLVIRLTRTRMSNGKSVLATTSSAVGAFIILVSWPTMLTMLISGLWHGAGFNLHTLGRISRSFTNYQSCLASMAPEMAGDNLRKSYEPNRFCSHIHFNCFHYGGFSSRHSY